MTRFTLPIPDQSRVRATRGYRAHPIRLESDENKERAVDLLAHGVAGANHYAHADNPPYFHVAPGSIAELYVREGVYERLASVNQLLAQTGLELFVFDAYRPVEVQNYFHNVWVPNYLRTKYPDWDDEMIRSEVGKYWAAGAPDITAINPLSPPPHATGAVVDLTFRNIETGALAHMGSPFDAPEAISYADHFEHEATHRTLLPDEVLAMQNRRTLYHAMSSVGFVVNPTEWWHFGYGDQMSAFHSDGADAVYSLLKLPE